jgi:hypothetical protein
VKSTLVLITVGALLLGSVGCGSSETTTPSAAQVNAQRRARRHAEERRAARRHRIRVQAKKAAIRRRARRAHDTELLQARAEETEARQQARAEEREQAQIAASEGEASEEATSSECDPNYSGACLNPNVSDYDCEGGSGNGPYYTGEVTVVGVDHYGLDADGDGVGCEAE